MQQPLCRIISCSSIKLSGSTLQATQISFHKWIGKEHLQHKILLSDEETVHTTAWTDLKDINVEWKEDVENVDWDGGQIDGGGYGMGVEGKWI